MNNHGADEVNVLKLTLHDILVGYLTGFQGGRNVLTFADEYKSNAARPTFSLITHPDFPRAEKLMAEPWTTNHKLHPTLSNLLPEGALREDSCRQRISTLSILGGRSAWRTGCRAYGARRYP